MAIARGQGTEGKTKYAKTSRDKVQNTAITTYMHVNEFTVLTRQSCGKLCTQFSSLKTVEHVAELGAM